MTKRFAHFFGLMVLVLVGCTESARKPVQSVAKNIPQPLTSDVKQVSLVVPAAANTKPANLTPISTQRLMQLEEKLLPAALVEGPWQFDNVPAYYFAANPELKNRLDEFKKVYESKTLYSDDKPCRGLTLISGPAGIGKTFIKHSVLGNDYPKADVAKFDVKEYFLTLMDRDEVEKRADIRDGDLVLNSMYCLKDPSKPLLQQYLSEKNAKFYVIDSLDEVHPEDFVPLLNQAYNFVAESNQPFLHVVVLGRPEAFYRFWQTKGKDLSSNTIQLFELNKPEYKTTGDLTVSSWGYDTYKWNLKWAPNGQEESVPLDVYNRWQDSGFSKTGEFKTITHSPCEDLHKANRDELINWAKQNRDVVSGLRNLAGNAIIREIVDDRIILHKEFNDRIFQTLYLEGFLRRLVHTAGVEHLPPDYNPEELEKLPFSRRSIQTPLKACYLRLMETIAVKMIKENRLGDDEYFTVEPSDRVSSEYMGFKVSFRVVDLLDLSGIVVLDIKSPGPRRYRFEPLWLHKYFVEGYNRDLKLLGRPPGN